MTSAIDQTSVVPTLPPCPAWCQDETRGHQEYDGDPFDDGRENIRSHIIEYDNVNASTDRRAPDRADHPHAFVCVVVVEKNYGAGLIEFREPKIALEAEGYPYFTRGEARKLAAILLDAADRADEIARV